MNKNFLIIAGGLAVCSWIIVAGFQGVQSQKAQSIERQQVIALMAEKERETAKADARKRQEILLDYCLDDADDSYWSFMEKNGTGKRATGITASTHYWDTAKADKKTNVQNCYSRYPLE